MAWFKNKVTGLTWEIADAEHAERLTTDPAYEKTDDPTAKKSKKKDNADPDAGGNAGK